MLIVVYLNICIFLHTNDFAARIQNNIVFSHSSMLLLLPLPCYGTVTALCCKLLNLCSCWKCPAHTCVVLWVSLSVLCDAPWPWRNAVSFHSVPCICLKHTQLTLFYTVSKVSRNFQQQIQKRIHILFSQPEIKRVLFNLFISEHYNIQVKDSNRTVIEKLIIYYY